MAITLLRRLRGFTQLSEQDEHALGTAASDPRWRLGTRVLKLNEQQMPSTVLVLEGFACRYTITATGRRQILAFLQPGDLCELRSNTGLLQQERISSCGRAQFAAFPPGYFTDLTRQSSALANAFELVSQIEQATLRQWLMNLGQRDALARTSHLLCELVTRMHAIGLVDNGRCKFPFTQVDLADALALSAVHTNRVLQEIKRRGAARLERHHHLTVGNFATLKTLADFNSRYLLCVDSLDATNRKPPGSKFTPPTGAAQGAQETSRDRSTSEQMLPC
jgi:CRP-like cAMP-binding protein